MTSKRENIDFRGDVTKHIQRAMSFIHSNKLMFLINAHRPRRIASGALHLMGPTFEVV